MEWSEKVIQKYLTSARGPVPFVRYISVPNVSYGFCYSGESDLLSASEKGYLTEFEIKVSLADLKRDKKKDKHLFWNHEQNLVAELWYVMPEAVYLKASDDDFPDHAGVMTVTESRPGWVAHEVRREAVRKKDAVKLDDKQRLKLARLGCIRYWSSR